MTRPRYIKTHIFAAALYACACLMVYGTAWAAAQARPVAAKTSACVRQQQCSACSTASGVMFSTVVTAEQNAVREFLDQPAPLPVYQRHALSPASINGAASCALLSRRLADA